MAKANERPADYVTRWLDGEEQRAWRSYLRAVRLVDEALRRGLEEHGMSHPEYEILVRLSEVPGHALRIDDRTQLTLENVATDSLALPGGTAP